MKSAAVSLLLLALAPMATQASESVFYVGSAPRDRAGRGIYVGSVNEETGKLGPLVLAAAAENATFLAASKDGKFLYAAMESHGSAVGAFRVEGARLVLLGAQSTGGGGVCHVGLDATGHYALAANYGTGSIAALPLRPDGSVGERTGFAQLTGTGPDASRQEAPHAHSVDSDETGRFVYTCDLGTDRVWIFRLDPGLGTLTPADPPAAQTPPGSGPRHLAWHPGGKFAYVNGEMKMNVTAFARSPGTGGLAPRETVGLLPPDAPPGENSSAEVICHPNGKWLYVSNRGHDSLTVFAIGEDGRLTWVENVPSEAKFPRSFAMDPGGRWLLAAGQKDDRIVLFRIDPATGKLAATGESAAVGTPLCVLFAPAAGGN